MKHRYTEQAARLGIRSTLIGAMLNVLLAAIKAIAGVLGNSYALIADAVESAADVASSLIVIGGIKIASIPADEDHPYGHGKAEPLAAMIVAVALCTAAIGIAIESLREIMVPHHAPAPFTLIVLVAVVATKEMLFRFVTSTGEKTHSTAVKTDAWHHRSDAITSSAAFVGISVALIGGRGYESADDIAALFASCIIAFNGYRLLIPAIREIMDAAPASNVEADVRAIAGKVIGVSSLDKCFVRKMGFEYFVDLHVVVDGEMSVRNGHAIAHEVKAAIQRTMPMVTDVLIHIEPEVNHE